MSEVKRIQRYSRDFQGTMSKDSNGPWVLVGDAAAREGLLIEKLDAQCVRADTAEAELKIVRKSRDDELENYNALILEHAAAVQRIAEHESMLRHFANCADRFQVGTAALDYVAALNPNPEAESHELAKG